LILNAVIHDRYFYAENWQEMMVLIGEVMENLQPERRDQPWIDAGETASFSFADRRHSASTRDWWPDNYLEISVNTETGYGGLAWFVTQDRVTKDDVSRYIWVSDNPAPPDFDPRVVGDPGVPYFYDPRSTLPLDDVRAALEEFCRTGTGDRPECVRWVHGEMNGLRHD
jgi:hypothetical protein